MCLVWATAFRVLTPTWLPRANSQERERKRDFAWDVGPSSGRFDQVDAIWRYAHSRGNHQSRNIIVVNEAQHYHQARSKRKDMMLYYSILYWNAMVESTAWTPRVCLELAELLKADRWCQLDASSSLLLAGSEFAHWRLPPCLLGV